MAPLWRLGNSPIICTNQLKKTQPSGNRKAVLWDLHSAIFPTFQFITYQVELPAALPGNGLVLIGPAK
ncbi:hypothetical protein SAMN05216167_105299 [Spirosoma endophyticum]|uniref:Uncharacterized protein n=1 Tax=Spirosoma endophyticum TaxID=662367 RepID=A0A1I1T775_9BACT|nr:hypothetical protein SAMN05216167_105299 [Spirosoma endophyticum]